MTNWLYGEKPQVWRSTFVFLTTFSKSSREKSWKIWLNVLVNRFTVEPPFWLLSGIDSQHHHDLGEA